MGRPGRKPLAESERRNPLIKYRVTEDEKRKIERFATVFGYNGIISNYARARALQPLGATSVECLRQVLLELAELGRELESDPIAARARRSALEARVREWVTYSFESMAPVSPVEGAEAV